MRRSLLAFLLLAAAAPALAKPPIWDRTIDSPKRFKVLKAFDAQAVLDQETGVVWERQPAIVTSGWAFAMLTCVATRVGGRGGWRLPTVFEMRALLDTGDALPAGHPFQAADAIYWTSTTVPELPGSAFVGDLGNPMVLVAFSDKTILRSVWCVRGGAGATADTF
jgi:hypothetical protein